MLLRAAVEHGELGAALLGERENGLPPVGRRRRARDEAAGGETAQQAAQERGIKAEALRQRRSRRLTLGDLIEHARFAQRIRRLQQALPQEPDLARVEAIELPHPRDAIGGNGLHVGSTLG